MYNLNMLNYKEKYFNNLNYINNYQSKNRVSSPKRLNNPRITNYYNDINHYNNILYKNINSNEEIYSQYQNNTNPINRMHHHKQQYPNHLDYYYTSENFYPSQNAQNIYYENYMPDNINYLYKDTNYIPNIIQENRKNKISKEYIENKKDLRNSGIDGTNNGLKLNITNCETQYPQTYLNANPFKKREEYIKNYNSKINNNHKNVQKKSQNNSISKTLKKIGNRKNFNLSKIEHMSDLSAELEKNNKDNRRSESKRKYNKEYQIINNIKKNKKEKVKTAPYFHKKNKSLVDFSDYIRNEKHYIEDIINNNNNLYEISTDRMNDIAQRNKYNDELNNYLNFKNSKKNIKKNKNKSYDKYRIIGKEKQERYILKISKFINLIEKYYIISFYNFFYYFINQLSNYNQIKINNNKNLLLKRFQRTKNKRYINYYSINNKSNPIFNNSGKKNNKDMNKNIIRNIYIPKKNIEQYEINKNTFNSINHINTINYNHHKNNSIDCSSNRYPNDLIFSDNGLNLSAYYNLKKNKLNHQKKDNSLNKINYQKSNLNLSNNMNKSLDNLIQNKLSNNVSIHKNMNKKGIIYIKPRTTKLLIKKKKLSKEKEINNFTENNSINFSNTINNINSNFIYNNIFHDKNDLIGNNNINFNTQNNVFTLKNIEGFRSPISKKKEHIRYISDLDLDKNILDYENLYNNKNYKDIKLNPNNIYDNIYNDNKINEIIGNEDLIEETIIKDICTYDKKLWVFIKYIISPRAKHDFLKMKIQKKSNLEKGTQNIFLNKELNNLKSIRTDSIELIGNSNNQKNNYKKEVLKEISEEKESNEQEEGNLNNKLSNMIDILEEFKKQNFLFFYKFFFNIFILNYESYKNKDNKNIDDFLNNKDNNCENNDSVNNSPNNKNEDQLRRNLLPDIINENQKDEENPNNEFNASISVKNKKEKENKEETNFIKNKDVINNEKEQKLKYEKKFEEKIGIFKNCLIKSALKRKKVKDFERNNEEEEYDEEEEEEEDEEESKKLK